MESAVVLCSGGLNSTVAAARTARYRVLNVLYVDYGHPAAERERSAVHAVAHALDARRVVVLDLPHVMQIRRGATSGDAGREVDSPEDALPEVTVPGLAASLLTAAAQWAEKINARTVVVGTSQLCDEADRETAPDQGAPDHHREFYHAFNILLETLRPPKSSIQIETPLIDLPRADVIKLGLRFGAPLDVTWSCHHGGAAPCGRCPGCVARFKAYLAAGETDPLTVSAK
jgi:7-cyano-7-deazaguanine synthase